MEGMLKQGLAPVYAFADRAVSMGVRPEHYEVIAAVLPTALEVRDMCSSYLKCYLPTRERFSPEGSDHGSRWACPCNIQASS